MNTIILQIVYKNQLYIIGKFSEVIKRLKELRGEFDTIEEVILASEKKRGL